MTCSEFDYKYNKSERYELYLLVSGTCPESFKIFAQPLDLDTTEHIF